MVSLEAATVIRVNKLTKVFGTKTAVDQVSFSVKRGQVLGFLGPNGAGKSTTMRMITGFLPPTSGSVTIDGLSVASKPVEARKKLGYLPENAPVYPDMTVESFLSFCAEARGYNGGLKKERVRAAIDKCFLETVVHQRIGTLSKGYRQRVCFAQSILHDPPYLIMDEPTDGLDPNQKHEVRQMIRRMSRDKAILLSTHILDEVDAVCHRALIIANGRLIADDTPEGLRRRSASYGTIVLVVKNGVTDSLKKRFESLEEVKKVDILSETGSEVTLRLVPAARQPASAARILAQLEQEQDLISFAVDRGRLDDVFRTLTGADSGALGVDRFAATTS